MKGSGFYEAVAQILPILAILLLYEARVFRVAATGWPRAVMLLAFLVAAFAEARALYALWSEKRWAADYFLVTSPLWFLIGLMFAFALVGYAGQERHGDTNAKQNEG
jgi:hypothetical protein